MGLKFMFSCNSSSQEIHTDTTPNPNKYQFTIKQIYTNDTNDYTIAIINYPHCTTFNGDKLLVIKGDIGEFEQDPHFIEGNNVIARFEPTEEGLRLANIVLNNL